MLQRLQAALPANRAFRLTVQGSAPLQLTLDRELLSGDVDLFSDDDEDLSGLIADAGLDKSRGGLHLEFGFELSFRTSPRWRQRARTVTLAHVTFVFPHPIDILIGKLDRLEPKDLEAFRRVRELTGHPTAGELQHELQNAVDLFRPGFGDDSPNRYPENTRQRWRELFGQGIDIRRDIIEPAIARRRVGYGETPPDYKSLLGG
ncbi:MAG: hypothetical protein KF791_06110 [Verrucomicrobiae bacterium]|nr:hypothetical protein [Verrucomicrobiae bacterium]